MKKLLISLFSLFLFGQLFAQNYKPFPTSNAVWNEVHYDTHNGVCQHSSTYIKTDTIINGKTYHKFETTKYISLLNNNNCGIGYNYYVVNNGYFRNDSINQKIWYINPSLNVFSDTLLFDFNLQVGDTLPELFFTFDYYNYYIDSIDYINYGGVLRKRLFIKDFFQQGSLPQTFLIEGVGSNRGLFQNLGLSLCCYSDLNCFSENSQTVFPDSTSACQIATSINKRHNLVDAEIIVFPNPVKNKLSIQGLASEQIRSVRVFDLLGNAFQINVENRESSSLQMNLSQLVKGVYFIQIETESGFIAKKIVKQ